MKCACYICNNVENKGNRPPYQAQLLNAMNLPTTNTNLDYRYEIIPYRENNDYSEKTKTQTTST